MKLYKIKNSKINKKGLYANCNIKKGTKIIQYKGKIITRKYAEEATGRRDRRRLAEDHGLESLGPQGSRGTDL